MDRGYAGRRPRGCRDPAFLVQSPPGVLPASSTSAASGQITTGGRGAHARSGDMEHCSPVVPAAPRPTAVLVSVRRSELVVLVVVVGVEEEEVRAGGEEEEDVGGAGEAEEEEDGEGACGLDGLVSAGERDPADDAQGEDDDRVDDGVAEDREGEARGADARVLVLLSAAGERTQTEADAPPARAVDGEEAAPPEEERDVDEHGDGEREPHPDVLARDALGEVPVADPAPERGGVVVEGGFLVDARADGDVEDDEEPGGEDAGVRGRHVVHEAPEPDGDERLDGHHLRKRVSRIRMHI